MANASEQIKLGRVLHEDDDFITLEIGKRDSVTYHLQQNDDGETVGGDQFFTLVFLHNKNGKAVPWDPFVTE